MYRVGVEFIVECPNQYTQQTTPHTPKMSAAPPRQPNMSSSSSVGALDPLDEVNAAAQVLDPLDEINATVDEINDAISGRGGPLSTSAIVLLSIGVLFFVMFVVSVVVAAVYTAKFNSGLELGRIPPGVHGKEAADLMASSWVFVGFPFVNIGLASGFAHATDHAFSKVRGVATVKPIMTK